MKKVMILSILMPYLLSSMECKAETFYKEFELHNAITYLQEYNRVHVTDVVVLGSSNFYTKENDVIKDVYDITSQNENIVKFSSSLKVERNITQVINTIQKFRGPSIVILPDFEDSENVQIAFFDLPVVLTRNKFWLIFLSSNYSSQYKMNEGVKQLLSRHPGFHSNFFLDSQVYFIGKINGVAQLFEIYQICKNWNPTINYLATVTNNQSSIAYIWENRRNLGQCVLRVGYLEFVRDVVKLSNDTLIEANTMIEALQSKKMRIQTQELALAGYSVQRFKILQSNLNFSIKLLHVDDQKVGSFDFEANQWNGIVGMLRRNEIDTSLIEMTITEDRKSVISFATPSLFYTHYLYSLKPGPSVSWSHYTNVFDYFYWSVLVGFILLLSIFNYFYFYYSSNMVNAYSSENSRNLQLINSVCQSLKAFIALDIDSNIASQSFKISKRMLVLVMCFCGALNFYVYNAMLISYLMAQKYSMSIQELPDILTKPEYKLLVFGDTADEDFLKYSNDPLHNHVWKKTLDENGFFSSYGEAEKRLFEDDKMVLFGESPSFETIIDGYQCQVVRSKIGYNKKDGAFPFQAESPYDKLFSHFINKMMEKGLMVDRVGIANGNKKCEDATSNNFRALSYKDVILTLPIFLFGCIISIAYLTIENVYKKIFLYKR